MLDIGDDTEAHKKGQDHGTEWMVKKRDLKQPAINDAAESILNTMSNKSFADDSIDIRRLSNSLKSPEKPTPSHPKTAPADLSNSMGLERKFTSSILPVDISSDAQSQPCTEWRPNRLLCQENQESANQFVLLILNQPIENKNLLKLVWKHALFRIAADGAGNRLLDLDANDMKDLLESSYHYLQVICGDLDSLEPRARQYFESRGTSIVQIEDQDSTDFQKCTDFLRKTVLPKLPEPSSIVCLGGLGGRVDQGLSQLHQLYKEQRGHSYNNGRIYFLTTEGLTFVLLSGTHRIHVRDKTVPATLGMHIGIIPLKEPSVITTKGLEWDVTNWKTEFGGQMSTSNLVREDLVEVTTTKDVLFTIDLDAASIAKLS